MTAAKKNQGVIDIHGKQYKTVALRVNEFREAFPDWSILTELVSNDSAVVMKASILNPDGRVIATGYAEEIRGSTNINKTSSVENCETSAIGRSLAAFGLAGEEYASADEVKGAIEQQSQLDSVEADWLSSLGGAPTLEELKDVFERATEYAKSRKDQVMLQRFVAEKDKAKARLS